jgi:hypothetical protein
MKTLRAYVRAALAALLIVGGAAWADVLDVVIDVAPGNPQNPINMNSNASLQVAVFSRPGFDATQIDVAAVRLGDPDLGVAAPAESAAVKDIDRDGLPDLLLQFRIADLAGVIDGETEVVVLTATTGGGLCVRASDFVRVTNGAARLRPSLELVYSNTPAVLQVGTAMTPMAPSSSGGRITAYAVSPPLPPGIGIDPVTGVISGTPLSHAATTTYVVTGTTAAGSATATVEVTVLLSPPSDLTYAGSTAVAYVGTPIAPLVPSSQGGPIDSYSVSPSLPPGIELDPFTGVIAGTPLATSSHTHYTVTGSNAAGSTVAIVDIVVY